MTIYLSFFSVAYAQEKKVPLNITNTAEAVMSGAIILDDFTGSAFGVDDLLAINEVSIKIKEQLDIDVYEIGFPSISSAAKDGLSENFNLTSPSVTSDKNILLCFLYNVSSGSQSPVKVIVDIGGNHGYEEVDEKYLELEIGRLSELYFQDNPNPSKRMDAHAKALEFLLNYDKNSEFKSYEGFIDEENQTTTNASKFGGYYVSGSGEILSLPPETTSIQCYNLDASSNWPSSALLRFTIKDNTGQLETYVATYKGSEPELFGGYRSKPISANSKIYPCGDLDFSPLQDIKLRIGLVQDACGSFDLMSFDYRIPNDYASSELNCILNPKVTDSDILSLVPELEVIIISQLGEVTVYNPRKLFTTEDSETRPCTDKIFTPEIINDAEVDKISYNLFGRYNYLYYADEGIFYWDLASDGSVYYLYVYDYRTGELKIREHRASEFTTTLDFLRDVLLVVTSTETLHTILDVAGTVDVFPAVSVTADFANGLIYLAEDQKEYAYISFASMTLGVGIELVAGKYALKILKNGRNVKKAFGNLDGIPEDKLDELLRVLRDNDIRGEKLAAFNALLVDPNLRELSGLMVNNPKLVRAWDACFIDDIVRINQDKLTKVSRYFDNNPGAEAAFKAEFNVTPAARRGDFVDRTSWADDLKKAHDPNGNFANFSPQGFSTSDVPQSVLDDMAAEASSPQFIPDYVKSGSSVPQEIPVSEGYTLYKAVPKAGDEISDHSAYWVKLEELNSHGATINFEQKLGLPVSSHGAKYDVFKIEVKPGKQADVFESTIANTVEAGYSTTGGATQSLVLDRGKWTDPELVFSSEIFPPAN